MIDLEHLMTGLGGLGIGSVLVAWRKGRTDAGKLALEIARDSDKKADRAIAIVDELRKNIAAHLPWDAAAAVQIRKLGGTIVDPPPLL